jgi:phosphonate transport system substrate-binding protein
MVKEFNGDDRFYPITYQKDWAVVRKIAEDSGTPYNKAAHDAEAKREADAIAIAKREAEKKAQQQGAPKQ